MSDSPALPRADESWFRKLAETTTTGFFIFDLKQFYYANPAAERLTGYSFTELQGLSPVDLVPEASKDEVRDRINARLRYEETPSHYELPLIRRDGEKLLVDYTAKTTELDGRNVVVASAFDITRRDHSERALRRSQARLELAQKAGRCVTWEWDLPAGTMTISDYAQELFGLSGEPLSGAADRFLSRFSGTNQQALQQAVRRTLKDDVDFVLELPIVNAEGEVRWMSMHGQALRDGEGRVRQLIGVASDVSDQRRRIDRMRLIVDGTSEVTGEDFFRCLVRYLAQALELHHAFVGKFTDASMQRAEIVAAWTGTDYQSGEDVRLEGTALEAIADAQGGLLIHESGVHELFPDDRTLREMRAEAFLAVPLFDSIDQPLGFLGVLDDAPLKPDIPAESILRIFGARAGAELESMRAQEALFEEKERAQVTLDSIGDGVLRTDINGRIDFLNAAAEDLTGWAEREAFGKPLSEVYRPLDETSRKELPDPVYDCLHQRPLRVYPGRKLIVRRDGSERAVRDTVAPVHDQAGLLTGAVLVLRDVSELRGLERQMDHLASHDRLTGLLNRHQFEDRLQLALSSARDEGRRHVVCYLDLDEFKAINDAGGHDVGDKMLQQIADLLRQRLREGDILARLGDDEFGVLLEDCSSGQARILAEAMRRDISSLRFTWEERVFTCTASIGLVAVAGEQSSVTEVLRAVDSACFVAKDRGGDRLHNYQPEDSALAARHGELQWLHRIPQAIEEGRLCLYAQPIQPIRGTDGRKFPFQLSEVFVRLIDQDGELVAPGAFIPAAEKYRLVSRIDRWVVHTALGWLADHREGKGLEQALAINISGQSLSEENFLEDITDALKKSGVDPTRVCFEITETAAISNLARASLFFSVLRDLGCRFALDDFGTGVSSFAYLRNLPVDFIKIDGEFVRTLTHDPSKLHRTLVESIRRIGEVLGIHTIAEYVENEAIYHILEEIGIDFAQGYWVGRPAPLGG